ncbi:MAG: hypothetical protein JSR39_03430 [Verrucomicrobia bacterium]|nr:hypothetical protein [Verrucomicrobiota bacterium]
MAAGAFREIKYNGTDEFLKFREVWCNPNTSKYTLLSFDASEEKQRASKAGLVKAMFGQGPNSTAKQIEALKGRYFDSLTSEEITNCKMNMEKVFGPSLSIDSFENLDSVVDVASPSEAHQDEVEERTVILKNHELGSINQIEVLPPACKMDTSFSVGESRTRYEDAAGTVKSPNGILDFARTFDNGISYVFDGSGHGMAERRARLEKPIPRPDGSNRGAIAQLEKNLQDIVINGDVREPIMQAMLQFKNDLLDPVGADGTLIIGFIATIKGKQYAITFQNGDARGFIFNKQNELIFETNKNNGNATNNLGKSTVNIVEVKDGDALILASDGIFDFVYPKDLLSSEDLQGSPQANDVLDSCIDRMLTNANGERESGKVFMDPQAGFKLCDEKETGLGQEGIGRTQWDPRHDATWDDMGITMAKVKSASKPSTFGKMKHKASLFFS